jgi:hypothetical protein
MMKIPAQAACGLRHSVRKHSKHKILLSAHAWVQNPLRSTIEKWAEASLRSILSYFLEKICFFL